MNRLRSPARIAFSAMITYENAIASVPANPAAVATTPRESSTSSFATASWRSRAVLHSATLAGVRDARGIAVRQNSAMSLALVVGRRRRAPRPTSAGSV